MSTLRIFTAIAFTWIAAGMLIASAETINVPADQKTIQAAVDVAKSGDTILVAAGTYQERIRLKNGVTIKSVGNDANGRLGLQRAEATIIDGGGEQGTGPGVLMAEGSTIDGFTVTNVGSYDDAGWKKHHETQGNQQSHELIGHPGTPGISVDGITFCSVKNNVVHHIGSTGIAIQAAGVTCSPLIHGNVCFRNMGGGIGSMMKSTAIIEQNTCFQNFYAGIGHDDASPTVINNVCYENIRAGIGISHGSCPVVRGNQCYRNRRAGIGTRTGGNTRPLIIDNDCYENDMAGIGTEQEASPLIRNNRCYKNKLAGIGSQTRATPIIINNECYENGKVGIGQESDAMTVLIDNNCHHNKAAGIGFNPCVNGQSIMTNNRVVDNALVAVGISKGWSVKLTGNELSRTGGMPPIVMVFEGAEAQLHNNIIRGSGVAGVRVAGKVQLLENDIIGTKMRPAGPPNFAVWALPGSDVMMSRNQIEGWRNGLHANEATITATQNTILGFHQQAIVIEQPLVPPTVHQNTMAPTE